MSENFNKAIKKEIRSLNINEIAKKELYNLLKYIDLKRDKNFFTGNFNVAVNDYTKVNIEKVVNLVEKMLKNKIDDIDLEIREEENYSNYYSDNKKVFIVKVTKKFCYEDGKFKDFY